MSDDTPTLVERLREKAKGFFIVLEAGEMMRLCDGAADALESALAHNAELVGALGVFVMNVDRFFVDPHNNASVRLLEQGQREARITLSRTPAQLLDRMRKERAVIEAAREPYTASPLPDRMVVVSAEWLEAVQSALAALDTEPSDAG